MPDSFLKSENSTGCPACWKNWKNWKKDNKFQVGAGKTGNVKCQIFPLNIFFSNTRCQKDFNDIAEHKIFYNIFIYASI